MGAGVLASLALAAVIAPGACYEPDLASCAVACESDADCGPGQTCDGTGLCTAGVSCAAAQQPPVDAAIADARPPDAPRPPGDARPPDAPRPPDAGAPPDATPPPDAGPPPDGGGAVALRVRITDRGHVVVPGVGTCSSQGSQQGDCTFAAPSGASLQLYAVPGPNREFDRWTSSACSGQGALCTLTLQSAYTEVRARFKHE